MKNSIWIFASVIVLAVAILAGCEKNQAAKPATPDQDSATAASADVPEQTVCPVMGGKINKDIFVEYNGRKVYFCCKDCLANFNKNPEPYMKKLAAGGAMTSGMCNMEGMTNGEAPEIWTCSMHPKIRLAKPGSCPECGMKLVPLKEDDAMHVWTCPMHPDVKVDKPGKCPKCGMKLIEEDNDGKMDMSHDETMSDMK